ALWRSTFFPYTTLFRSATGNSVRVDPIKSESAGYLYTLKLGGTANGRFVPLLGCFDLFLYYFLILRVESGNMLDIKLIRKDPERSEEHTSELQSRFDLV